MRTPAVSVLIDTYNHERFIEEAIVSVLEQDFPQSEMEILVVDDGSTDRTPEIVRKFAPLVRHLRKPNGGQASAFNAGIPAMHGEIAAFLDGDDWWTKQKLTTVFNALQSNPEVGIVGHGNIFVHADGSKSQEVLREGFRFQANTLAGAQLFRLRKAFMGTCRMAIRRELLQRILPVPEALVIQADEYIFTLAAAASPALILPEPLFYYRLHGSNAFMIDGSHPGRMRTKQAVLACLADVLLERLRIWGIDEETCRAITEIVKAEADQLRLMLDGGLPWETVKTEWKIYQITCGGASAAHRVFKPLSLLPAFFFPPRMYYDWKDRVAVSSWYRRTRQKFIANPPQHHVETARRSEV